MNFILGTSIFENFLIKINVELENNFYGIFVSFAKGTQAFMD